MDDRPPDLPQIAPPALQSSYAKVERAQEHAAELNTLIQEMSKDPPYEVRSAYDEASGVRSFTFHGERELPLRWGVIFAEAAYQLRSALDHLFARVIKQQTGKRASWSSFPIHEDLEKHRKFVKGHLRGISSDVKAVLDQAQPYHDPEPSEHPLALLNALVNFDKHEDLHPAWVMPREMRHEIEFVGNANDAEITMPPQKALRDGDLLYAVRPIPYGDVRARGSLVLDVGFGDQNLTREDLRMIGAHVLVILAEYHALWGVDSWQPPLEWRTLRRGRGWSIGGRIEAETVDGAAPVSFHIPDQTLDPQGGPWTITREDTPPTATPEGPAGRTSVD